MGSMENNMEATIEGLHKSLADLGVSHGTGFP